MTRSEGLAQNDKKRRARNDDIEWLAQNDKKRRARNDDIEWQTVAIQKCCLHLSSITPV